MTTVSLIPALNEDCIALIIPLLDRSSLRNVAGTSKAGNVAALPFLFSSIALHIEYPGDILNFCESVLRNRLAKCIRRLTLFTCEWPLRGVLESEFRDALSSLANIIASAESLASLRICPSAQSLFDEAPAVLDTILLHPPSHSLELADIADVDWLVKRQLAGLRNISLGFTHWQSDIVDLFAITAGSAATLEMIHLCLSGILAPIKFREGFTPYSKLRMLSIACLTSSDMAFPDFHLADLCKAFPNVQFIRFCGSNTLMNEPALSGSMIDESQSSSRLIGLEANIESLESLQLHHRLRIIRVQEKIESPSSFARLMTAIAPDSLCSLSLYVDLQDPSRNRVHRGVDAEYFFAEICRIAPRLRFLSLEMYVVMKYPDRHEHLGYWPIRQHKAVYDISTIAWPHLAGLEDLRCFHMKFKPHVYIDHKEPWVDLASLFMLNLPRIRVFVLDVVKNRICLERPDITTMPADGTADIVDLDLDEEDMDRLMEPYQFEGSDWRLDGAGEWLRSVRSLSRF